MRAFFAFSGSKKDGYFSASPCLLTACVFRAWTCLGDAGGAGGSASTRDAGGAGDADAGASSFVRGACVEVLLWTDSSCPRILFFVRAMALKDG